jgi:hypothetical protein
MSYLCAPAFNTKVLGLNKYLFSVMEMPIMRSSSKVKEFQNQKTISLVLRWISGG